MNNREEWNEFLLNLFDNAFKEYKNTKEYEYLREKQEQLDALLTEKYPRDKKEFYDNYTFEMGLDEERGTEFLYRKGMKDCILILKELGVLA